MMTRQFFHKLSGSLYIARKLSGQTRIPYLPLEQLNELRDRRVRAIVQYAARTVPYYRDLFRDKNINPNDIKTAADLSNLPLLDKRLVREQPERFISTDITGQMSLSLKTSGSTGTPLTIVHDRLSVLANAAFSEREKEVVRETLGKGKSSPTLLFSYPEGTVYYVRGFVRENAFIPSAFNVISASFLEPVETGIDTINRYQPALLVGSGTYIELLFKVVKERRVPIHLPKLIIYAGSPITEEGKHQIEAEFGVPVLSHYNAVEAFKIGYTCTERAGFHLHDDLIHVRIINKSGMEVAPGEEGEVVISNLVNRGTVLLNYRLGDVAALSPHPCPCGRTFRTIEKLGGRVEDFIQLPGGKYIHPRSIWMLFKARSDVLQYQLTQHTFTNFELALTVSDPSTFEQIAASSIAQLHHVLGNNAVITATRRDLVEAYGARKFRPVVSLVKQAMSP
jgi:phenylacetate-CoA ligase